MHSLRSLYPLFTALIIPILLILSCNPDTASGSADLIPGSNDSLKLAKMISDRERAMIKKDISLAMAQFADGITWINSQGYFFEGKSEVLRFHQYLAGNDSLDYYYEAGTPRIRILDTVSALSYYSWKMFWYKKQNPADTVNREIGLMTLTARKIRDQWKWVAVTNQHTPWFYEKIEPVVIE